jgi:hypothetical protein
MDCDFGENMSFSMDRYHAVRCFDIGGSGIKTGLLQAASLAVAIKTQTRHQALQQLQWIDAPRSLGKAPSSGLSSMKVSEFLRQQIGTLEEELGNPEKVIFGVSCAGTLCVS